MTLLELIKLLRLHVKRIAIVVAACTVVCFVGSLLVSVIKPSYTATSTVVTSGGVFTSVSGLADAEATSASTDGATVSATATTSNNTVTFTAKGSSSEATLSAVNDAADNLAKSAKKKQVASDAVVNKAELAKAAGKSPVLYAAVGFMGSLFCMVAYYVLIDTLRGGIHAPEAVEERGLTYLGTLSENEARMRIVVANFHFSNKNEGFVSKNVLLQPASPRVRIRDAYDMLAPAATEAGIVMRAAPALEDSVYTLYKGREADTVIVVVEEEITTFDEVDELIREFKIANIRPGGFVYLPYDASVEGEPASMPTRA